MRRWMAGVMIAASLAAANALAATRDVDSADARKAVQEGDWPRAIASWHELYLKGDREAAAQLCTLYFDARQGEFDAARVVDWCRRAAANGDAWARLRMGLLYLAGTGVDRDANQAQVLCATAASLNKPDVPAGFCLAAVAIENQRTAQNALQPPQPETRAAATPDPAATPSEACRQLFATAILDVAAVAESCKKAAAGGRCRSTAPARSDGTRRACRTARPRCRRARLRACAGQQRRPGLHRFLPWPPAICGRPPPAWH